jgi:hypothetical protein
MRRLLWLFSAPAVHAGTTCHVVDLMPDYWQALATTEPATQLRAMVVAPHPDLYNEDYVSLPSGTLWED